MVNQYNKMNQKYEPKIKTLQCIDTRRNINPRWFDSLRCKLPRSWHKSRGAAWDSHFACWSDIAHVL